MRATTVVLALLLSLPASTAADPRGGPMAPYPGDARPLAAAVARAAAREPMTTVAAGRTRRQSRPEATARCRRWRRVLIGAGLGAAGAAPLATLVHRRFENEAADGGAVAAWTVGLGALVGALIANATCDG